MLMTLVDGICLLPLPFSYPFLLSSQNKLNKLYWEFCLSQYMQFKCILAAYGVNLNYFCTRFILGGEESKEGKGTYLGHLGRNKHEEMEG